MPYIPYTDEQKQLANSVDLPTFLRMRGEKLVPVGREFKLVYHDGYGKHDSITISGSQWYDHKNQIGGGPIKFMREHYGMNFQEAMQALLGHSALPLSHEVQPVMAKEKKEFRLPEANDNMHRVYAYLIKQRHIAPEVITHFAKRELLYEDKKHHNAVFVGVDSIGAPRQAHKRSTTTFGKSFRQTIEGSDTKYSFAHFGKSNMLFVFEAPIDMMSFLTLYPKDWEQHSYIAMNLSQQVDFQTIDDYVIMICYYLKLLKVSKTEIRAFLREFERITDDYIRTVDITVSKIVVNANLPRKISALKISI